MSDCNLEILVSVAHIPRRHSVTMLTITPTLAVLSQEKWWSVYFRHNQQLIPLHSLHSPQPLYKAERMSEPLGGGIKLLPPPNHPPEDAAAA